MDIKHKTSNIRTWKKHLFLDISSTNIDTIVPSLYPCVETHSIEIFFTVVSATSALPFQPLRHQRNIFHPAVKRFTLQTLANTNSKHFFMNIFCIESFCPQKTVQQNAVLR
jgi:hypothetical protein